MKNVNYFFSTFLVVVFVFLVYSCAKEGATINKGTSESLSSIRSLDSDCSPQTLYTEYDTCTHQFDSLTLSFALGFSLYSTDSELYDICPGLQVKAYFTKTKCNIGSFEVHFVHDLSYSLADIIAACPALQAEIDNQIALGNLESFLDLIDDEISRQTEFTLAYNAALNSPPGKYLC